MKPRIKPLACCETEHPHLGTVETVLILWGGESQLDINLTLVRNPSVYQGEESSASAITECVSQFYRI